MAVEELVELKFRLADGSDIGPNKYSSSTTVTSLKEKIIAQWPKGYDFLCLYSNSPLVFVLFFSAFCWTEVSRFTVTCFNNLMDAFYGVLGALFNVILSCVA